MLDGLLIFDPIVLIILAVQMIPSAFRIIVPLHETNIRMGTKLMHNEVQEIWIDLWKSIILKIM